LDSDNTVIDPPPAAMGLGLAGFLVPLLQPVLGMLGQPTWTGPLLAPDRSGTIFRHVTRRQYRRRLKSVSQSVRRTS